MNIDRDWDDYRWILLSNIQITTHVNDNTYDHHWKQNTNKKIADKKPYVYCWA